MRLPLPSGATEAYETLRQRVIQPDGRIQYAEGRSVLTRCGLARWAQVQASSTTPSPPDSHPRPASSQPEVSPALEVELVKLVAGLILSIRQESMHA